MVGLAARIPGEKASLWASKGPCILDLTLKKFMLPHGTGFFVFRPHVAEQNARGRFHLP